MTAMTPHERLVALRRDMRILMALTPDAYVLRRIDELIAKVSEIHHCQERTELLDDLIDYRTAIKRNVAV
jgi:hypothetical protein